MPITATYANPIVVTQTVSQGGAASGTTVSTLTRAVQVVDFQGYITTVGGGAGNKATLALESTSGAIMAATAQATNNTDKEIIRAAALDDANWSVTAGQTLTTTIGRDGGAGTAGVANVNITCMDVQ